MDPLTRLKSCTGFDWDIYNSKKIWVKHRVDRVETEEVFSNEPVIVAEDIKHSEKEPRFYALGHTDDNRRLFVVFTIRGRLVRVISARDMSRKERKVYDAEETQDPKIQE